MKRRIRQNIWDNWQGYEGTRRVRSFGCSRSDAEEWLETGEVTRKIPDGPGALKILDATADPVSNCGGALASR